MIDYMYLARIQRLCRRPQDSSAELRVVGVNGRYRHFAEYPKDGQQGKSRHLQSYR